MKRTAAILAFLFLNLPLLSQSTGKLLPIAWADHEVTEYRFRYPSGRISGTMITSVAPVAGDSQRLVLESRYNSGGDSLLRRIEVRADSMEAVTEKTFSASSGNAMADYNGHRAQMQAEGGSPKTIDLTGPVFTYEELPFVFRRLPLAPGYKTMLPVMTKANVPTRLDLAVAGIEEIKVPAGTFQCYKLELQFQLNETRQLYWIATDQRRLFVKADANGFRTELVDARTADLTHPVAYQDSTFGLTLTAPPGWIVQRQYSFSEETFVSILDPEATAFLRVLAVEAHGDKAEIERQLRAQMEEKVRQYAEGLQDYRVRPDSVRIHAIGGSQALSCVADYVDGGRKMVHYLNWLRSENANAQFNATVRASDFPKFRESFDPILESVRIK